MATFSVRIADELARRFDLAAAERGGRSARLRQLILEAAGPSGPAVAPRDRRDGARLMVRLSPGDVAGLDAEAANMGLRRSAWVAALVRRRVRAVPTLSRSDARRILMIQADLRRIGVNLDQIARALNTAVIEGRVLELEMGALEAMRREIRGHLRALREALAGNLDYWEVDG